MEPSSLPFSLRMGLFVATAGNFLPFVPPAGPIYHPRGNVGK